jgi:predicted SAM-dependent methyltransferase
MPPAFSPLVELEVDLPLSRAQLEELGVRGLQSGCGTSLRPGWLNSDHRALHDGDRELGRRTVPERLYRIEQDRYFIQHSVPDPYPIEPESLEWAFSEHFIEHLPPGDGIAWLAEMRRLLVPGGLVRVVAPDLRKYMVGYSDPSDPFLVEHARALEPHFPDPAPLQRPAFIVNKMFYGWGHKWMYDFEELRHAAVAAGFAPEAVVELAYREGRVSALAEFDLFEHSFESLYVEIEK